MCLKNTKNFGDFCFSFFLLYLNQCLPIFKLDKSIRAAENRKNHNKNVISTKKTVENTENKINESNVKQWGQIPGSIPRVVCVL